MSDRWSLQVPSIEHFICLDKDNGDDKSLQRFMDEEGDGEVPAGPASPDPETSGAPQRPEQSEVAEMIHGLNLALTEFTAPF